MRTRSSTAALTTLAVAATLTGLVACTPPRRKVVVAPTSTSVTTIVTTITRPPLTRAPVTGPGPSTASSAPTGAIAQHDVQEKAGTCPYLSVGDAAKLNGSRLNRHTIITTDPVGCMFYALNPTMYKQVGKANRPTVGILTARYRTDADAQQGMVREARAGTQIIPQTVAGHQGAEFRTRFNPTDGDRDWSYAFVLGTIVVTVKTDRTDTGENAFDLAEKILPELQE